MGREEPGSPEEPDSGADGTPPGTARGSGRPDQGPGTGAAAPSHGSEARPAGGRPAPERDTGRPDGGKRETAEPGTVGRADREHLRELQRQRRGRLIRVLLALGIAVLLIIFIVSNAQPVAVDFVFVTRSPRLIWVMFGCAVLGGAIGYLIGRPGKRTRLHADRDRDRPD